MEILLGIEHLHQKNIIYRDLKAQNVLLDSAGHCRISDLGLACYLEPGTFKESTTGTIGYMAPEVLKKEKYGLWVDWWSFGCLLFEMLKGRPPFSENHKLSRRELKDNTLFKEVVIPEYISEVAACLIKKLLVKKKEERLGFLDALLIKEELFFKSYSWSALQLKRVDPPFFPEENRILSSGVSTSSDAKSCGVY
ncbi:G protein-coupled receptor kinase 5-like [Zophobas morio]|uniref:G protein-coupled receptor kinase 5-like n=1 Tax=Zophobas morio TaxID=2755281 RepID=UPI00308300AE